MECSLYTIENLLFGQGFPQQGIHVCIRGVSAAATFVLYNQCVLCVLGFALENGLPDV